MEFQFERAKFGLKTQREIRGEKSEIRGRERAELKELTSKAFNCLEDLREIEEGRKNERVILELAQELNINEEELTEKFKQGLRFNIKGTYKIGFIDEESTTEDIDTIVGGYTLNFRSALNWFKREKEKGRVETPRNILEIAKRMYILSPRVIEELRKEFKEVDGWIIKRFVVHNPTNPEGAIRNCLNQIETLRNKEEFEGVDYWIIKHFAVHNPTNPERAIKNYLNQIETLRNKEEFKGVNDGMIKYFVVNNPTNPEKAIKNCLNQIETFRNKEEFEGVDYWIIKHFAIYYPTNPEKAIRNCLNQIETLRNKEEFKGVDDWIIEHFAVHNPTNPEGTIEEALERIEIFETKFPEIDKQKIKYFVIKNIEESKEVIKYIEKGNLEKALDKFRKKMMSTQLEN